MVSTFKAIAAAALLAAAAAIASPPAQAADVARRCSSQGCSYIYCDRTGDRCCRVDVNRDGERINRGTGHDGADEQVDHSDHPGDRSSRDRDRSGGNPYYRPRHRARHDHDRDDDYGPDDRYQDRYRYDDRW